jgi:hypothetical protein
MVLPCRKYIHSFTHLPCWCSHLIEFASQHYSFANSFHDHLFFSQVWCQNGTRFFFTITFRAAKLLRSALAWKKFKISSNFSMVFSGRKIGIGTVNHVCLPYIDGTGYCENRDSSQWTKMEPFTVSRWRLNETVTVNSWWALYAWSIPYWNQYTVNHPVTFSVPFIIVGTILVGNWNIIAALPLLKLLLWIF